MTTSSPSPMALWAQETEIPSDRARYGVFDMLSLEVEQQVRDIILDASERGGGAPGFQ